jgi:glyoxylase-like metal-dependent hydrolase (beta-lactamase superfamily II)
VFIVEDHGPLTRLRMAQSFFGRPIHEVSAYRVGDLLIDSGPPETAERLAAWCQIEGIRQVVLTHHHEDHAGGAPVLAEKLGLAVSAPAPTAGILASGARVPLYRRLVWGTPRRVRAAPLGEVFEGGGCRFQVIPTPGHAFDHVCLFEETRGWLVSGDLFVHERVKFLRRIEDLDLHLESLRKVRALEPTLLLCAHAGVVRDGAAALARKIAWWEETREKVRELQAHGLGEREIARRLLGGEGFLTYLSLGDFSKRNLVRAMARRPT